MVILALKTHSCAFKTRMRYYFEVPLSLETLEKFSSMKLHIHPFSQFVKGAKDSFKLMQERPPITINGVVGEKMIDVLYGPISDQKVGEKDEVVEGFEKLLLELELGQQLQKVDRAQAS